MVLSVSLNCYSFSEFTPPSPIEIRSSPSAIVQALPTPVAAPLATQAVPPPPVLATPVLPTVSAPVSAALAAASKAVVGFAVDRSSSKDISTTTTSPALSKLTLQPTAAAPIVPPVAASSTAAPASSAATVNTATDGDSVDTLPALQTVEYAETKMKLSQIMRDFADKKINFISAANDGTKIMLPQYHAISTRVKQGDDIGRYLKGKLVSFITAVDRKKKSFTETKLFVPEYEIVKGYIAGKL